MIAGRKEARVFLCYARADITKVKRLYEELSAAGFKPWMDVEDILGGEDWRESVLETIRQADFFVACLSKSSVDRRGVIQEEIREALDAWRGKLASDIYLIPARLEECEVPKVLARFQWVDLLEERGFERLRAALRVGLVRLGIVQPLHLRSTPIQALSEDAVLQMLIQQDFFDRERHWLGRGILHDYERVEREGQPLVLDHATRLTWQQSGSEEALSYDEAAAYVTKLRDTQFAGNSDWRLPTLEEAMSLVEPTCFGGLHLSPLFDAKQSWIWTADRKGTSERPQQDSWVVALKWGSCFKQRLWSFDVHARGVR